MFRLLLLTILLTPILVLGQTSYGDGDSLPLGVKEQVSVKVSPSVPKPGEDFNISVESFSTDLNNATITWTVGGSNEASGRGVTSYSGTAPLNGKQLTIVVTIIKNTGGTLTETVKIAPADVDLVYEAQTYTHPFYKGKSLYSSESNVRIVAFPNFINPNGSSISSENLIYTWKIDKKVMQSQSGFGRNTIDYKGALITKPIKVEVTVESLTSGLIAKNSIILGTIEPLVLLFEKNPTLGTLFEFNLNSGRYNFSGEEIEIIAEPFFYSTSQNAVTNLDYKWSLNGKSVFNANSENSILFRKEPGSKGLAIIKVLTEHTKNILQSSSSDVSFDLISTEILQDFEF